MVLVEIVQLADVDKRAQPLERRTDLLLCVGSQETSGAEIRAEVHHVQDLSSVDRHVIDLHNVVEPERVGTDG